MKKAATNMLHHQSEHELSHSMVHYLLAIHRLKETNGYARVTDIARIMDLTKGSVSTALNTLKKRDLVVEDESKFLSLSALGHEQVHSILASRTLLYYFLKDFVGVEDQAAHHDACLMEHLLSSETRHKFFEFMKKMACLCDEQQKSSIDFKTSLDLCSFESEEQFTKMMKEDRVLEQDDLSAE